MQLSYGVPNTVGRTIVNNLIVTSIVILDQPFGGNRQISLRHAYMSNFMEYLHGISSPAVCVIVQIKTYLSLIFHINKY